jgi:hypothetical protein
MNAPKTLNEAREQLEAVNTQLAELRDVIEGHEAILEAFGMKRITEADGETVHYESTFIQERDAQIAGLNENVVKLTADNKTLSELASGRETSIATLTARITQLEASAKTVEARAREMLASQGGPPLAVDGSDSMQLTADDLRKQLNTEKDPNARFAIYSKLKAQETKSKRINGTR